MGKQTEYTQKIVANTNIVNAQMKALGDPTRLKPDGSNLSEVYQAINETPMKLNSYVTGLSNWISEQVFNTLEFESPLARFVQSSLQTGQDVQEIYTGLAREHKFKGSEGAAELFSNYVVPTVQTIHTPNRDVYYPITIKKDKLQWAFQNVENLAEFHNSIFNSLYIASRSDEFDYAKEILNRFIMDGSSHIEKIEPLDSKGIDSKQLFAQTILEYSELLKYKQTWNKYGVVNFTPKNRQVLILSAKSNAALKTGLNAFAFNREDVELPATIVIDDFGDDRILGMLADERVFKIYDKYRQLEEQNSAVGRSINFFYSIIQIISMSGFSNSVTFVSEDIPEITKYVTFDQPLDLIIEDSKVFNAWLPKGYEGAEVELSFKDNNGYAELDGDVEVKGEKITYKIKKGDAASKEATFSVELAASKEGLDTVYGIQVLQLG